MTLAHPTVGAWFVTSRYTAAKRAPAATIIHRNTLWRYTSAGDLRRGAHTHERGADIQPRCAAPVGGPHARSDDGEPVHDGGDNDPNGEEAQEGQPHVVEGFAGDAVHVG